MVFKTVSLGGVAASIAGNADDPYFQNVEGHAGNLGGLANLIATLHLEGATVIDVGANIGLSTILLARAARRVIAIEPSPVNADFLRANLDENGIKNVDVVQAAASSQAGALKLHVAPIRCRFARRTTRASSVGIDPDHRRSSTNSR